MSEIAKGGSLTIGGGDHDQLQRIHTQSRAYGDSKDWTWEQRLKVQDLRAMADSYGDHAFVGHPSYSIVDLRFAN